MISPGSSENIIMWALVEADDNGLRKERVIGISALLCYFPE